MESKKDPIITDGDKYKVLLENDRVRVLSYHDKPGQKTNQHAHPDYVMISNSSFKRRLLFPDGQKREVDCKSGTVLWMIGHTHIGENIGETDTDIILIELK